MRRLLKVLLYLVGSIVCLVALAVGGFYWTDGGGMCRNHVVAQYPSPDRTKSLVVFERDCGATTGFSTQALLLPTKRAESDTKRGNGNLLIIDGDHDTAPRGAGGGPGVRVTWRGNDQLMISYHHAVRVLKAEDSVAGVRVRYEILNNAAHPAIQPDVSALGGAAPEFGGWSSK